MKANGSDSLAHCPGYKAFNVTTSGNHIQADLRLAGARCNAYGKDLDNLKLEVAVETCKYGGWLPPRRQRFSDSRRAKD